MRGILDGVISIVVGETLIKGLCELDTTVVAIRSGIGVLTGGNSLDHHANSDVVVVSRVLDLITVLLEDAVESVIADDFSERLQCD